MKPPTSLEKLITEGRNLRDYILRVEGPDAGPLTEALHPFSNLDDPSTATNEAITALNNAFQYSFDIATKTIDERTLNDILAGRSPHLPERRMLQRVSSFVANTSLAVLAFFLVVTAFHYSYWANKTTFTLQEAEKFASFDHFQQMMKLVELKTYFESATTKDGARDLEPQLVYLEEFAALKSHYHAEQALPEKMSELNTDFNPLTKLQGRLSRRLCGPATETTTVRDVLLNCDLQSNSPSDQPLPGRGVPGWQAVLGSLDEVDKLGFTVTLAEVEALELETMSAAGRAPGNGYLESRAAVLSAMQTLREKLNVVHLWALPIVYGALGSVVFSIWRVLSPNVSSLALFHSLIRMIFAGLAALTLSMLLVPSNILTIGVDLNRPVIYLMAFIFGYSIEAFVSTLNLLNAYFVKSIAARKADAV